MDISKRKSLSLREKVKKRFVKFGLQSMINYIIIDFIDGIFIAH